MRRVTAHMLILATLAALTLAAARPATAQDLVAKIAALESRHTVLEARHEALAARVAALESRPPAAVTAAPDLTAAITPVLNGALTIQAYQHVFKLMAPDKPRGLLASLLSDDGGGGLGFLLPLLVTLKAIGTPLTLGF